MKTYLKILTVLAAVSFMAGYASAELPSQRESYERSMRDYEIQQEQNAWRNTMQRRMNQQYYNDRLQNVIEQQQDDIWSISADCAYGRNAQGVLRLCPGTNRPHSCGNAKMERDDIRRPTVRTGEGG